MKGINPMHDHENNLPHWDVSGLYPSLESAEFEQGFQSAIRAVDELAALFDQNNIDAQKPLPVNDEVITVFEKIIDRFDTVHTQAHLMRVYIQCFVHTNSRHELAQSQTSAFQPYLGQLSLLRTRLDAWLASFDVEQLLAQSAVARDHAFMLHKAQAQAAHQMSPVEERLAAKMSQMGSQAWTGLWNKLTSQLTVTVEREGQMQAMSMSDARKLAYSPDRDLRRRAYEAELASWEQAAVPLVAALNSIKGEQVLLAQERGWTSSLDATLADNNIDQQTLDALLVAVQAALPDFQRYLQAKAHLLGLPQLAWYDLYAPVGENGENWSYAQAEHFIVEQFGLYSPKLTPSHALAK